MMVEMAAQNQIDAIWPHAKNHLQAAIDANPNGLTLGSLYTACRTGHAFLMIGHDADGLKMASIWRFETWNDGDVFQCLALGGSDMMQWLPMAFECAKKTAALGGAKRLVANGRPGWAKIIKGVKPAYTAMQMEI